MTWDLAFIGISVAIIFAFIYWKTRQKILNNYNHQALLQALFDHSISCIYVKDMDLRYLFVNNHALKVFGYKEEEVLGKTDDELFPAPYAIASKNSDLKVIKEGMTTKEELIANLQAGDRDFYTIKTPLTTKNGVIYALCGVASDITKQKSAQRQLNDYLEKLEEVTTELIESRIVSEKVNRAQSAFLASMSHELRTPLNGIIGNTSLILNTEVDPAQEKYISRIKSSAEILLGIIEQVLDVSKIAAGKIMLEPQKVVLEQLIGDCFQVLILKAEEKKLLLNLDFPKELLPPILADSTRLKEVILNLIGNAIKFTAEGSVTLKVSYIAASATKVLVRMDVKDTGIGMSQEQLTHLFEKFWQGSSRTGGTGLGLAITKELVAMMNGEISVDSTPGVGTTITLKIPFELIQENA